MQQTITERRPDTQAVNSIQLCSFWISSRLFGVNILDVKEIGNDIVITPVFHAPSMIKGYMNIRGQIHLVIDIRSFFGFGDHEIGAQSRVVLFKSSVDEPFGILVDKMDDVVTVDLTSIEEQRKKKSIDEQYMSDDRRCRSGEMAEGVCKLKKGLLVVLNTRGILAEVDAVIGDAKFKETRN
jgi:purine-binding chemotaxis protein CheW